MNWSLILLITGGFLATIADILSKKWLLTSKPIFFIIGLAIYLISIIFLMLSFKYNHIVINTIIYILINIISYIIISYVFFKDPLKSIQLIGVALALIAIIILELF